MAVSCAPAPRALLSGEYYGEAPTERPGEARFLEATIKPHKGQYLIEGNAGYSSGRSVAPDFDGSSTAIGDGTYEFSITDSFGNVGTATVTDIASGISIEINIDVTQLMDPRCLSLYGLIELHGEANQSP